MQRGQQSQAGLNFDPTGNGAQETGPAAAIGANLADPARCRDLKVGFINRDDSLDWTNEAACLGSLRRV